MSTTNYSKFSQPPQVSPQWNILWRTINIVMAIFLALSAYVQLNDPDPYLWIPAYVVPSLMCVAISVDPTVTGNTLWKTLCIIHIALCLAGSLYLSAILIEILAGKIVNPLQHEEGRELGGLIIIICWLCLCRFTSLGSADAASGTNALLLLTGVLGLLPLFFWGLCFIPGLHRKLGHCNDMFPGMLGS